MTNNEIILVAGMAIVTFTIRYPVLAILGKIPLPDSVFHALRYVPPAVLSAIILPTVLMPKGQIDLQLSNAPLYAGIISGIIAWRTKNLLMTIIFGMLALWGWRWLVAQI